ncbi:MAG: hypothetical protein EA419_06695 [Wenzhouxiangella sp.]|nr:MAG: hypothetical protein EA419_06695 [Wenzhouxiangella sp.]
MLAGLSGCGVRTAYNNLDWLTVRWVNQQVTLNGDQRQMLREFLDEQLVWHCATQLPGYQAWIDEIRMDLLAYRLDRDRLADHGRTAAGFGRVLSERSIPILVDLAASLDDDQVEEVLAAFAEGTEEVRVAVEEKTPEELSADRLESMERALRRTMGRTNSAQQQRLQSWAASVTATQPHHLRQRIYWQDRLATALERRDDRSFLEGEMAAFLRPESAWSDEYRAIMENNRGLTLDALEEVLELADQRHLNRLSARLHGLKRDIERLSCEGEAPPELLAAADSA